MEKIAAVLVLLLPLSAFAVYRSPVIIPDPLDIYYVSPDGSGDQSGFDYDNAVPYSAFWSIIDEAAAGTAIRLLPGVYPSSSTHRIKPHGTPEHPIVIEGWGGEVVFAGNYQFSDTKKGNSLFILDSGNIVFRNFAVRNVRTAIGVEERTHVANVVIEGMSIDDVSECINIDHTGPRSADNWVISNISCTDYYRFAIRISAGIEGSKIYDTRDILIRNVYGNPCVDRTNASNFVVGVQVMRGAHHITIEDSLFVNHRAKCSTGDVNGDGIALEDSRSTHDITLRNVQVYDSGDAGIDSKVAGVSIENMTVVGARHSFKVWYFNDFVCDGCVSDRARDSHIHPKDGGLPIFRNTRLWCRGDQDAKPERVINSTKSSGVTAPAGAILQSVEVYDIELCEPNPAYNFKGELNNLSGLSTLPSDLQTTPEPVNPTYRLR